MEYMISYKLRGHLFGGCGNKTGTLEEVTNFARSNVGGWVSFSFFEIGPYTHGIAELKLINVAL